jgi:hypothetical protein
MIVSSKRTEHDSSFRIVLYDTDAEGNCVPSYTLPECDDEIDSYYAQRAIELERLRGELLEGRISPVAFFTELQHMDLKDLAARVKLSPGKVKRHMTPAGFDGVKVEVLKRYARVFDVAVADLFGFTFVPDEVQVQTETHHDRLLVDTRLSWRGEGE